MSSKCVSASTASRPRARSRWSAASTSGCGLDEFVPDEDGSRSATVGVPYGEELVFRYLANGNVWFDEPDADVITSYGSVAVAPAAVVDVTDREAEAADGLPHGAQHHEARVSCAVGPRTGGNTSRKPTASASPSPPAKPSLPPTDRLSPQSPPAFAWERRIAVVQRDVRRADAG